MKVSKKAMRAVRQTSDVKRQMRQRVFCALCLVFCVLCPIFASFADEATDLGRIVVTPARYAQDAALATSNVKVISSDEIAASGAVTLPGLLSQQTGVRVYNKGSEKNTMIDIGGYNDAAVSNVLVLLNGRRLNPSDSSGPDLSAIPLDSIDRIEIIRGGSSVLYGDNAVGGVVNVITRQGRQTLSGSVSVEEGSYGLRKETAEIMAGNKLVTVYAFGGYKETNGYRANNQYQAGDGQVRIDGKVAPLLSLGMEAGWHDDHYGLPSGLRGMDQVTSLGRRGTRTPEDYGDTRDRYVRFTSEWTLGDMSRELGVVSLDYAHRDRDTYGFYDYTAPNWEYSKTGILNDTAGIKYILEKDVFGKKASVIAGIDGAYDRSRTSDEYYDPNPLWASFQDVLISKTQQGYYLQGAYEVLNHLTMDVGGRYEKANYTFESFDQGTKTLTHPSATVWGGGLKYDYASGSNVFIRADKTFRFLNTDEWFSRWTGLDTSLQYQQGIDYRTGIKHAFGEIAESHLTAFLIRNRQEIFLDPTVSPGYNKNYGHTERTGVDVGQAFHVSPLLKVLWLKTADINLDYALLNAKFQSGPFSGKSLPMVPEHRFAIGFTAATQTGWSWNLTTRFQTAQFGINDDANTKPRIKPFMLVDTRVGYSMKDRWEVFVGINNLFNERYYDYVAYGAGASTNVDYYPAMDRNFVAGMKYRF